MIVKFFGGIGALGHYDMIADRLGLAVGVPDAELIRRLRWVYSLALEMGIPLGHIDPRIGSGEVVHELTEAFRIASSPFGILGHGIQCRYPFLSGIDVDLV